MKQFWILDFRFSIFDWGAESMNKKFWSRSFEIDFEFQSKIENRKVPPKLLVRADP
jgi:hypothetical protein